MTLTNEYEDPARILIVDDDRHNRDLLEVMLTPEGLLTMTAASGEEALALVAVAPPDLILLDVMMPGMDGYEVVAKLKGEVATRSIPVILITALSDRNSRVHGLEAGAEDFLSKPVDRTELVMRVRNLLRLKAYGDFHDHYGKMFDEEAGVRAAALVESERLFRNAFEVAPVGMVIIALDGRWLFVNRRLREDLAYSREELQGSSGHELLQSERLPGEIDAMRRMASGEQDRHVLIGKSYRRRDGSTMLSRVNLSVQRDPEGRPMHYIAVIEDLTSEA